jgi:acetylornithine deacetylase/succinyl-diaminopimelate desuccinylase-like protein
VVQRLGSMATMLGASLHNSANPTALSAGYKQNVIPGDASALIDARFLPGLEAELLADIDALLGEHVTRETVHHDIALEHAFTGSLVDAMTASLLAEDPTALVAPYCLSGGTDLKAFSTLGITGYGFSPLRLPADLDFPGMFHGVDERVPITSLQFGVRVLDRFLDLA